MQNWQLLAAKKKKLRPFLIKEELIKAVRAFFYQRDFHEIITPTLNSSLPLETNIYAFETNWQTLSRTKKFYLATSPESALKKSLAAGIDNCFTIAKSFRNLENSGEEHNPEFLMLEWYRADANYQQIMQDTEKLIVFVKKWIDSFLKHIYQQQEIEIQPPWPRLSLEKLFNKHANLDFIAILDETLFREQASDRGYEVAKASWGEIFDQIFLNEIESKLPKQALFLTDFPAKISPLCKVQKEKPYLAERFELFIAGMEIANGNSEETDARKVKKAFDLELKFRKENAISSHPYDRDFLQALSLLKGRNYAGIGLGIDRLAMIMADVSDIKDTNLFSF
ncbi:MAG: hypothetical protein PVJ09_03915 [Candidatus Woesebacteria bacterium]|jgi:elongation factor P--beta-lysine ligase